MLYAPLARGSTVILMHLYSCLLSSRYIGTFKNKQSRIQPLCISVICLKKVFRKFNFSVSFFKSFSYTSRIHLRLHLRQYLTFVRVGPFRYYVIYVGIYISHGVPPLDGRLHSPVNQISSNLLIIQRYEYKYRL